MEMETETEAVPIKVAVERLTKAYANNTRRINQLESQMDDLVKQLSAYRGQNTSTSKTEFEPLSNRIESIASSTAARFEEMTNKFERSQREWTCITSKLSEISNSMNTSSNENQYKTMPKEENEVSEIEANRNQRTNISALFPLNRKKHPVIMSPSAAAPEFHGNHSESPTDFLIHVQYYVETVYGWDRATLLNRISQFLQDSALDWYCQLRVSQGRPHTWVEFTSMFVTQFNSSIRKAHREQEWH